MVGALQVIYHNVGQGFKTIKDYFRQVMGGKTEDTTVQVGKDYIRMTVWMPEFVDMVDDNTEKMKRIAIRMNILARILELRNKALGK